jgi:hypothetical protein
MIGVERGISSSRVNGEEDETGQQLGNCGNCDRLDNLDGVGRDSD